MKTASLRGHGLFNNTIFDLNSSGNRDNCFDPYVKLKDRLSQLGVDLNTFDKNDGNEIAFELHQDFQSHSEVNLNYLLMFETTYISPNNAISSQFEKYKRIFTWRDDLVDGEKFIKINFPNPMTIPKVDGWSQRPKFSCLIAANKTAGTNDGNVLYPARVDAIHWFEKHAPHDFFLYGIDWDIPVMPAGIFGKILRRVFRKIYPFMGLKPFPSYHGRVKHKKEVLLSTRFSICYENVCDLPGYITEKIFDCFFAGCVPVYWGANNVTDYIPKECFIDRRDFHSNRELHDFLKSMPESVFIAYQETIVTFLQSPAAQLFGSDWFAQTVADRVALDLEN